ncbi:hypothetical protein [Intrasporangium sp.]|uniref:hypothetical protein n=1 Tax=Intrasporangium sp. TaxID=1925024 RepID=UPI00293954E8|nr:hypothetical protein [Intrasporangium sp.]MDV3220633.1 hypothetical protein [Intrasporangium sp.]
MKPLHRVFPTLLATVIALLVAAIAPSTSATAAPTPLRAETAPTATTLAPAALDARAATPGPTAAPAGADPSIAATEFTTDLSRVNCSNIRELGSSKVVRDKGMSAFTVRQYIGWCWDSAGSAWMNFSSVYVWAQYHSLGLSYRAQTGVVVGGGGDTRGYQVGANRQRLTYSVPVRTVKWCTQGWGKLLRSGSESAAGLTSLVC